MWRIKTTNLVGRSVVNLFDGECVAVVLCLSQNLSIACKVLLALKFCKLMCMQHHVAANNAKKQLSA